MTLTLRGSFNPINPTIDEVQNVCTVNATDEVDEMTSLIVAPSFETYHFIGHANDFTVEDNFIND